MGWLGKTACGVGLCVNTCASERTHVCDLERLPCGESYLLALPAVLHGLTMAIGLIPVRAKQRGRSRAALSARKEEKHRLLNVWLFQKAVQ